MQSQRPQMGIRMVWSDYKMGGQWKKEKLDIGAVEKRNIVSAFSDIDFIFDLFFVQ